MSLKLNKYQEEAASHVDGPCLVTSCPGSGKTFTLVERIVRLVESGVPQKNILCLTFTNKAANEMKERICKRLGLDKLDFFCGTFHAMCAKMIRKIGYVRGYSKNFTILDDKDQTELIMQIARRNEYDIELGHARIIQGAVNFFRDQMEEFSWVEDRILTDARIGPSKSEELIDISQKYLDKCRKDNLVDFSGLIYETIQIIKEDDTLKKKIQNTFKYIMVDETQDTNKSQFYLVNLLAEKWRNIMLIGDIDQCIVEGEKISTPNGEVEIENIREGDIVLSASGSGEITEAKVSNIYKKEVANYDVIELITSGGRCLKMSKEHIVFADYISDSPKKIVVYLMYSKQFGYRVGVTNIKRSNGSGGYSIGSMLIQERADYMWILKSVDEISEAKYWGQYYSIQYGIPSWCFYSENKGRKLDYSDKDIEKLFSSIDTSSNADKLMSDLWLFKERPHYVTKCLCENKRRNFTINMCADSMHGTLHRYMVSGSDDGDREVLIKAGLNVRDAGKGKRGWRVDSAFKSLGDVYDILKKVENCFPVNIIEKARLGRESLHLRPASHLREGMAVYVEENGRIEIDYVEKVLYSKYSCNLFDIDVEKYHNFISSGIVTHNSIYGWRGARYQNIQDFMDNYEDCTVISLSKNYRSTPQIVKTAHRLIKFNSSHMGTSFETDNDDGESVRCSAYPNQLVEADRVANTARRLIDEGGWDPQDIAVLYRVNKMSEPIETAMVSHGVPYEVIGAWNFYDRKEIRDCLGMLKFLSNPQDGIAFHRVCSLVSGMGSVTIGRIENIAHDRGITIPQACKEMAKKAQSVKIINACNKVHDIYTQKWDKSNPASCLKELVDRFGYKNHLLKKFDGTAIERGDNVDQLIDSAGEYAGENGISNYLQQVSLVTSPDKNKDKNKVVLMSLHAAKGLEFPIVFLIGVEDNILPHDMALADDPYAGLEEERRLCYVGMTRAKQILYMSWCKHRRRFGKHENMTNKASQPSRFLIESGLLSKKEK